jgi:hypothetical protein
MGKSPRFTTTPCFRLSAAAAPPCDCRDEDSTLPIAGRARRPVLLVLERSMPQMQPVTKAMATLELFRRRWRPSLRSAPLASRERDG